MLRELLKKPQAEVDAFIRPLRADDGATSIMDMIGVQVSNYASKGFCDLNQFKTQLAVSGLLNVEE